MFKTALKIAATIQLYINHIPTELLFRPDTAKGLPMLIVDRATKSRPFLFLPPQFSLDRLSRF